MIFVGVSFILTRMPNYLPQKYIKVVERKNVDSYGNALVTSTYGTQRANAYRLLEDALNLRDTKIYDTVQDADGEHRELNRKETMLAQQKQELIKEEFKEWIFKDLHRRKELCKIYNERFNSIRPREYDGSHIQFVGMNPEITLMPHQKNAVAHGLSVGGMIVDIKPITAEKSRTIEGYLARANQYLEEKVKNFREAASDQQKAEVVTEYPVQTLTFYVVECMEFPSLGEYHENLSFEETVRLYEAIPSERMSAVKGIGFTLHTEGTERNMDSEFDLVSGKAIDVDMINHVPEFQDSPLVQQAIQDVIVCFPDMEFGIEKHEPERVGKWQKVMCRTVKS